MPGSVSTGLIAVSFLVAGQLLSREIYSPKRQKKGPRAEKTLRASGLHSWAGSAEATRSADHPPDEPGGRARAARL